MTVFLLVRHAAYGLIDQGLGGRDPHPLSEDGREQAARLAGSLMPTRPDKLVSSPVRRAHETAEIMGARLGLSVTDDEAFTEIDFGSWTGARFDALRGSDMWTRWNAFRSMAQPPGGEMIIAAQARAVAGVARLAAEQPEGLIAVVSHADVIKAVIAHCLGMPLDFLGRLVIAGASVSRVEVTADGARVLDLNRCV